MHVQLGWEFFTPKLPKDKANSAVISGEPGAKTECQNKSRGTEHPLLLYHKEAGKPPKPPLQPDPTPTLPKQGRSQEPPVKPCLNVSSALY